MAPVTLLSLLCTRFPDTEREEHLARILCGEVLVDGECVRDPKRPVPADAELTGAPARRYVSRGGYKLEAALAAWEPQVRGLCFIDAGSSTGGFTDCLLQQGAALVYAVDVGRNQLDFRLRRDPRVVVLERTSVADLTAETFPRAPSAAVADLSFRSLRGAARRLLALVSRGWMIALVKPQFEWRAPERSFRGVVRDPARRAQILTELVSDLAAEGVYVTHAMPSPLPGRRGNREVLFRLTDGRVGRPAPVDLSSVVGGASGRMSPG